MRGVWTAIVFCGAFLATNLRADHGWGDDFAQYISHARNLAHHKPYGAIGFLPGGDFLGPSQYPPFLPIVLAPLTWADAIDWRLLKLPGVLAICVALWAWASMMRRLEGDGAAIALVLLLGLHASVVEFSDYVVSDALFLAPLALTFLVLSRPPAEGTELRSGVLAGVAMGVATLTRLVGVVLIPLPAMADILLTRRVSRRSLVALALALAVVIPSIVLLPGQLDYLAEPASPLSVRALRWFQLNAAVVTGQIPWLSPQQGATLLATTRDLLGFGPQFGFVGELSLASLPLALASWFIILLGVRRAPAQMPLAIFALVYFCTLVVHRAFQGERLALPLVPILLFYFVRGAVAIGGIAGRPAAVVILASAFLTNAQLVSTIAPPPGVESPGARDFLEFVRHTPQDAVVMFCKPRALALLTGRRSLPANRGSDALREQSIQGSKATFVVVSSLVDDGLSLLVQSQPERFRKVYDKSGFTLFSVGSPARARP